MHAGLLDDGDTELLRAALDGYTVDAVTERIGPLGQAALARADLAAVARLLTAGDPLETLITLFVLGADVPEGAARRAVHPLPIERAVAAGLLDSTAGSVRARVDVRPYGEPGRDWWVVSDFGADVRGGPLAPDHVLGIGSAALTLAQATPREPVGTALDIGTGAGIQALHLGGHAGQVVATDISERALRFAATTAALSGQRWRLRRGSLLEPVAGERFDLVVANPPFVISPGGGYTYRDGGQAGDRVSAALASGVPGVLAEDGVGQLLANWVITADRPWAERVAGWVTGRGCDAWVWQRAVAEPGEYATLWLRDAGEQPGSERWKQTYDAWLDWFAANGVVAVGMGLITLWRSEPADPAVVLEDVPQALEQPIGAAFRPWHARQRWLAATSDERLLDARLVAADDVVRERDETLGDTGWQPVGTRLRQRAGMRWTVDTDDAVSALIAGCTGRAPLRVVVGLLAAALGRPAPEVGAGVLPAVRDLVARGFLCPVELRR